jgi:hypothetical protein
MGDPESDKKELYRLVLFYKTMIDFLDAFFASGELGLHTTDTQLHSNALYIRLCDKIKDALIRLGYDLSIRYRDRPRRLQRWCPYESIVISDLEGDRSWEVISREQCIEKLRKIHEIFVRTGERVYPLDADDINLLRKIAEDIDALNTLLKHTKDGSKKISNDHILRRVDRQLRANWPDPKEHTTAKVWTRKDDTFCLSTKTEGGQDGMVEFALQSGVMTKQAKLMYLVGDKWPNGVSVREIIPQVYSEEKNNIIENPKLLPPLVKKIRSLVSDIRKKLDRAGINPDILPPLNMEATPNVTIRLNVAKLHKMEEKQP